MNNIKSLFALKLIVKKWLELWSPDHICYLTLLRSIAWKWIKWIIVSWIHIFLDLEVRRLFVTLRAYICMFIIWTCLMTVNWFNWSIIFLGYSREQIFWLTWFLNFFRFLYISVHWMAWIKYFLQDLSVHCFLNTITITISDYLVLLIIELFLFHILILSYSVNDN